MRVVFLEFNSHIFRKLMNYRINQKSCRLIWATGIGILVQLLWWRPACNRFSFLTLNVQLEELSIGLIEMPSKQW